MGEGVILARELSEIFDFCVVDYHQIDNVDQPIKNPFEAGTIEHQIYEKCWIDTVQWHYEDLIRDPAIEPSAGMKLKRKIDASNQTRTDTVEKIDDYFLEKFRTVPVKEASLNTESPGWVVDRLSILALKIYHMREQADRADAPEALQLKSQTRLAVLLEQRVDLSAAYDQLINDYQNGTKQMKVYRQMKLYNDPDTNPVLYKK